MELSDGRELKYTWLLTIATGRGKPKGEPNIGSWFASPEEAEIAGKDWMSKNQAFLLEFPDTKLVIIEALLVFQSAQAFVQTTL